MDRYLSCDELLPKDEGAIGPAKGVRGIMNSLWLRRMQLADQFYILGRGNACLFQKQKLALNTEDMAK